MSPALYPDTVATDAACMVSAQSPTVACLGPRMNKTAFAQEPGDGDDLTSIRLEPLKTIQLPEITSPSQSRSDSDNRPGYGETIKVTRNGLHDIEDRILRITGYYGYYPGYSSHRSKSSLALHRRTMIAK